MNITDLQPPQHTIYWSAQKCQEWCISACSVAEHNSRLSLQLLALGIIAFVFLGYAWLSR